MSSTAGDQVRDLPAIGVGIGDSLIKMGVSRNNNIRVLSALVKRLLLKGRLPYSNGSLPSFINQTRKKQTAVRRESAEDFVRRTWIQALELLS